MRNLLTLFAVSFAGFFVAQQIQQYTFKSADVKLNSELLRDSTVRYCVEARIGKKLYAMHQPKGLADLVPTRMNGLLETIHTAYALHKPLVLSPDAIWLALCQGFSIHVNENFATYRKKLFAHSKPKEIKVRNDSLPSASLSERNKAWAKLINALSDSVKRYSNRNVHEVIVKQFSTSGIADKIAFEITLLETVKNGFIYTGESGCGIPEITLKGSSSDWHLIYEEAKRFREFGLDEWIDNLLPILNEFVEASKGNVNREFWDLIYKDSQNYGESHISGWIIKLFPYVKEYDIVGEEDYLMKMQSKYVKNKFMKGESYRLSTLTTDNIPNGFSQIDIEWNIYEGATVKKKKMQAYSGFFGIKQDKKTFSLEPYIGWAICEKSAKAVTHEFYGYPVYKLKHDTAYWTSRPIVKPLTLPVYHPQLFRQHDESMQELKNYLQGEIRKNLSEFAPFEVSFVVTWGGTVAEISFPNGEAIPEELTKKTEKLLENLPYKFAPARARNIMAKGLAKTNYRCSIKIE